MRLLVTGASGFVGSALVNKAKQDGHDVATLTRSPKNDTDIGWDPASGQLSAERLGGFDAIIHLAGESIAEGRWNAAKKARIRSSRVEGTQLLTTALTSLPSEDRPSALVSASAIGYYGDRGDELLDESASAGEMFLSEVCEAWESACQPARDVGIRVVNARLGVILGRDGGAMAKMITPFRMGVGGIIGNGKQYWSWVTLGDVVDSLLHCVQNDSLEGPVNIVAPNPVTNHVFTKALGKVINRPTLFPMPGFAAKLALGEMAAELLLPSARVIPKELEGSGYNFQQTEIEEALRSLLAS